jgi:GINS complex subunit 2
MWRDTNTISELEFLAETELMEIIPNFKKDEVKLMCGTYGPFKPNKPVKVPLWLAVQFKKNKKCRIVPPIWLDLEFLSGKVELEKGNDSLQDLPFYFFEIYQILFHK